MFEIKIKGKLRKLLQRMDEDLCRTTNSPKARFIERGGPTLLDLVGRNNPWGREWTCPCRNNLPCQSRGLLAAEEEDESAKMLDKSLGKEVVKRRSPEDRKAIPSCTSEGVNYIIECYTCRRNGLRRA